MVDLILCYRECREDWLRMLACDNGLPFVEVQCAANQFGEREEFDRLVYSCEGYGSRGCSRAWWTRPTPSVPT